MLKLSRPRWGAAWIMLLLLMGCLGTLPQTERAATSTPTGFAITTQTPLPPTLTATLTSTITSTPEPADCQKPPEDYTRLEINGWTINQRTFAMLTHAQELYGGELEINGYAITQGSYHDNGPLIHALRMAGFAAWLREYGELYADSPIHIHAIAIGDQELSAPAEDQLTGPAGYFRGYNGLPASFGGPFPDRHGGPILCQWMIDLGYQDLR